MKKPETTPCKHPQPSAAKQSATAIDRRGLRGAFAAVLFTAMALGTSAARPQDRTANWTVFPLAPCALADIKWPRSSTLELAVRDDRNLWKQGGSEDGCAVPKHAEAVLVDVLVDASRAGKLSSRPADRRSPSRLLMEYRSDRVAAQQMTLELCQNCRSDLQLSGARAGERVRLFVRGYLVRGQRSQAVSTDRLAEFTLRERQRVEDCQTVIGPNGEIVQIGVDCGLNYEGVPYTPPAEDDTPDDTDDDAATPPVGCPYDYFPESEWFAQETRFAFPIEEEEWISQGPIHYDRDADEGANKLDCDPFFPGVFCYDGHGGTDFSLIGGFWKMDQQNVHVVAAAPGIVMDVRDGNFDRCEADTDLLVCDTDACYETFLGTVCPPCVPNPKFGEPHCTEGDEPNNYDSLQANSVKICHADGRMSRYLHLMKDSILVSEGDAVDCGTRLALIGSSGRSSGPHLHFDAYEFDVSGRVDPFAVDPEDGMWVEQSLPGFLPGPACQED